MTDTQHPSNDLSDLKKQLSELPVAQR